VSVAGRWKADHPSLEYVLPFAVFLAFMVLDLILPISPRFLYPLRLALVLGAIAAFSWPVISFQVTSFWPSVGVGIAVWLIWICPDVLWPDYRHMVLFENGLTGTARSSIPDALRSDYLFLLTRVAGSVLVVPVIEELFWRSWIMRWLIDRRFWKIPLGGYTVGTFWTVAILFAVEHGPYWDVGLAAGVIYNWWMIRTRSLGDCILAHAVTNACLSMLVLGTGQWQYWM
jgi:CAAX prenyl protease-like protein